MMTGYVRAVLEHSDTKGNDRLLLLTIAAHADGDGIAYPGNDCLAREANISVRQVQRIIPALVGSGEIEIIQPGNGRGQKRYLRITLPIVKGDIVTSSFSEQNEEKRVTNPSTKGDIVVSPFTPTKGDISSVKGDISEQKGDIAMSPELKELFNKQQQQQQLLPLPKAKARGKSKPSEPPEAIEQRRELLQSWLLASGAKNYRKPKINAGIMDLYRANCTPAELTNCYRQMQEEKFWKGKTIFPQSIFDRLDEFRREEQRKTNTYGAQNGKPSNRHTDPSLDVYAAYT